MRISFASQPIIPQQGGGGPARRPVRNANQSRGGRGAGGRGGGNRRRQDTRPRASEADLDADMDSYMATPVSGLKRAHLFTVNLIICA